MRAPIAPVIRANRPHLRCFAVGVSVGVSVDVVTLMLVIVSSRPARNATGNSSVASKLRRWLVVLMPCVAGTAYEALVPARAATMVSAKANIANSIVKIPRSFMCTFLPFCPTKQTSVLVEQIILLLACLVKLIYFSGIMAELGGVA